MPQHTLTADRIITLLEHTPENAWLMKAFDKMPENALQSALPDVAAHYTTKITAVFAEDALKHHPDEPRSKRLQRIYKDNAGTDTLKDAITAAEQLVRLTFCLPEEIVTQRVAGAKQPDPLKILLRSLQAASMVVLEFGNPDTLLGLSPTRYGPDFMDYAYVEHRRQNDQTQKPDQNVPYNYAFHRLLQSNVLATALKETNDTTVERLSDQHVLRLAELRQFSQKGPAMPDACVCRMAFTAASHGRKDVLEALPKTTAYDKGVTAARPRRAA